MAKFNRFNAGIALIGLLGIVSALALATYNFVQYQLLQIESENLQIERKKAEEDLDILPDFDRLYPDKTDYRKPIVKIAGQKPKIKRKAKISSRDPEHKEKGKIFYRLMKCWKCGKPFRSPRTAKKGKCPHCGAGWALK